MSNVYKRAEIEKMIIEKRGIKTSSAKKLVSYLIYGTKHVVKGKIYHTKPELFENTHFVRVGSKFIFTEEGKTKIESLL